MKLAEAKKRVDLIGERINVSRLALAKKPAEGIAELINELVELLAERDDLLKRIAKTEWCTLIGGTSMVETKRLIDSLAIRVSIMQVLSKRTSELPEIAGYISSNLRHFSKTKESLEFLYQKNLWSIDILDE